MSLDSAEKDLVCSHRHALHCLESGKVGSCLVWGEQSGPPLVRASVRVIKLCESVGVSWTLENPTSSALWGLPSVHRVASLKSSITVDFQCCAYGCCYVKPTRLVGTLPGLASLEWRCAGGGGGLS